jgi:hypothetical protein
MAWMTRSEVPLIIIKVFDIFEVTTQLLVLTYLSDKYIQFYLRGLEILWVLQVKEILP